MTKKIYVYCTLAASQEYTSYASGGADLPLATGAVHIRGGANVADEKFNTPLGMLTVITEAQHEMLRRNSVFLAHEANGYILVSEERMDPETAAADMETRSPDAPLVEADFEEGKAPVVLGASDDEPPAKNPRKA